MGWVEVWGKRDGKGQVQGQGKAEAGERGVEVKGKGGRAGNGE